MKNFTEETYDFMFGMGIPTNWKYCTSELIKQDVSFPQNRGILAWLFSVQIQKMFVDVYNTEVTTLQKNKN